MFNRFLCVLCFVFFSTNIFAEEKSLSVDLMLSPEAKSSEVDLLTLKAMQKALSEFYTAENLKADLFWSKLNEKKGFDKLPLKDSLLFLRPYFLKEQLAMPAPLEGEKIDTEKTENSLSIGVFRYEIDAEKTKKFHEQIVSDLPDFSQKSFFIVADIDIDESLTWTDLGITKAESFSGVIKESWRKLATEHFKGFDHYIILAKDIPRVEGMHPQSLVLKWKSRLKKTFTDSEQKNGKFELSAQYVLTKPATNESLLAFDFPGQKRDFALTNAKALSSGLASLIYNLLNSQTSKIATAVETSLAAASVDLTEFKITSGHGLSDLYQVMNTLNESMKAIGLKVELKTFSNPGSVLLFKSNVPSSKLIELLSANGGRIDVNEQKLLVFNPQDKSFAIIPKDGNN